MYTCNLFSEGIVNWVCMVRLYLAPLPVVFLRQEYWSGLSFPSPGDLPNLGIKPRSPALQVVLCQLSHEGNPSILEWVVSTPVEVEVSLLRWIFLIQESNWGLSIAGKFFTN